MTWRYISIYIIKRYQRRYCYNGELRCNRTNFASTKYVIKNVVHPKYFPDINNLRAASWHVHYIIESWDEPTKLAVPIFLLINRVCPGSQLGTRLFHYTDVIMTTMASQITSLTLVYLTVFSDADQRKHQSSASLAFVWGIHRDRWIPRTKGQLRGKCFHLRTSSCAFSLLRGSHGTLCYQINVSTFF